MASFNKSMYVFLLLLTLVSFVHSINNVGVTVDLIHRDSPLSPSYDPYKTRFERLRGAFDRSFARKSSLVLTSSKSLEETIEAPISPNGGEYLMEIQIGTPPVEQLAIADTGSDLTWIQCKPCTQCYKQKAPLFDSTKTKSFRKIPCQSDQCVSGGSSASCVENIRCLYHVSYGDNSFSYGEIAAETFTFRSNTSFPNVLFGCGHYNDGTFSEAATGIVGLGGGRASIVQQLNTSIGGRFSYCLALLDSNVSSKISFGRNAVVEGPNVLSTPLFKKSDDTFYYLTLEGISVGAERVEYKSGVEASSGEGNVIIDSGTTLTFVPSGVYDGIESALKKAVKGKAATDPQGTFKLCYQKGGFSAPPITAHFRGADLVLPQVNTFVEVEKGIVCLTLLPSEEFGIFGNLNQMNFHVGYDLVKQQVNFLPTDCTKPT